MQSMRSRFGPANGLSALLLIAAAIAANIALGHLVQYKLQWPLFLDSIGAILVGALLGPLAGAATGVLTNLVWGALLDDQSIVAYAITAAFIGWAAGMAAVLGAFRRLRTVLLAGLVTGFGAALISAPITAYLYGGVTGAGTDYVNAYLTATGASLLQATTVQGFISDPVDKMISFTLAWLLWRVLRPYFTPLTRRGTRPFDSLRGYSVAVAASLLAVLLAFVFLPAFERGIFAIFYFAVLVSALRGGLGPALVTTAVGAAANILFLVSPYYNVGVTAQDWLRVGIFTAVSLAIAGVGDRLEKSKQHLENALQAEREGRARIQAITDNVNEALTLVSSEQRVLDVNRRFVELFGVPQERLVGQLLADTRTMFDQVFADAGALFDLLVTGGAGTSGEHSQLVVQQWPQARELHLYSTPVADAGGFLGRLFVFRDVTREREVDRMKTEFVSLVSHELRTPLTSIKGFTELVLDGDAGEINEEVAEYLGIVHSNADRLVALVNDLLDLSRIESGRIQIKAEPVDLQEVVRAVVQTMQQKLAEKQQSLAASVAPDAAGVIGDRDKLVQVLTNYVSNAHKYTQAGGAIQVNVSKRGDFAHVAVADNGYGIAPADQDRLFTRFYRVDNSMTREVGGTGLGLAIVKQMIELQGGEVGVESALGRGSTFWFTMPVAASQTAAAAPAVSTPALVERAASILVVEDDANVARLVAHHLQKAGYSVRTAANAEEALSSLAEDLPDLITLDIELPGMQGDDLARKLHDDPLTSDIPILVISVSAGEATTEFGAYALPKPIDQHELMATVASLLQEHQTGPVLIIDDDADVRTLLATALGKQGLQVETAVDGERGLVQANAHRPGLILLDMRLPGMDGFAVLRALKESPATSDVPVIVMTGSLDLKTSARARVLALGASDFVAKPFDISALVEEIKLFLAVP